MHKVKDTRELKKKKERKKKKKERKKDIETTQLWNTSDK